MQPHTVYQFQNASGRKFDIADFRYYISNIVLIKMTERIATPVAKLFLWSGNELITI